MATLLSNLHLPNFLKGTIFQGSTKQVCVPGLNCYSCPGAAGACPIGAMQAVVGSSKFKFSYYITGMLIFIGEDLSAAFSARSVGFRTCCIKSRQRNFQPKNSVVFAI